MGNDKKKRMDKSRTPQQDAILLQFMQTHVEIARGQYRRSGVIALEAWQKLTAALNKCGPPFKSEEEWRRTWGDCKQGVKKKLAQNRRKVGRHPYKKQPLTTWEHKIAVICQMDARGDGSAKTHDLEVEDEDATDGLTETNNLGREITDVSNSNFDLENIIEKEKQKEEFSEDPFESNSLQHDFDIIMEDSRTSKDETNSRANIQPSESIKNVGPGKPTELLTPLVNNDTDLTTATGGLTETKKITDLSTSDVTLEHIIKEEKQEEEDNGNPFGSESIQNDNYVPMDDSRIPKDETPDSSANDIPPNESIQMDAPGKPTESLSPVNNNNTDLTTATGELTETKDFGREIIDVSTSDVTLEHNIKVEKQEEEDNGNPVDSESIQNDNDVAMNDTSTYKHETPDSSANYIPIESTKMEEPTESSSPFVNNNEADLKTIAGEIRSLNVTTMAAKESVLAMGSRICLLLEKGLEERQKHNALLAKLLDKNITI